MVFYLLRLVKVLGYDYVLDVVYRWAIVIEQSLSLIVCLYPEVDFVFNFDSLCLLGHFLAKDLFSNVAVVLYRLNADARVRGNARDLFVFFYTCCVIILPLLVIIVYSI